MNMTKYDLALKDANHLIQLNPRNPDGYLLRADIYYCLIIGSFLDGFRQIHFS